MLNSTKTWQEEVIKEYCYWDDCQREAVITTDDVRKLIKDLRKRDMEALIRMLPKKKLGHINQEGFCDDCGYKICRCYQTNSIIDTFKKIIKDHYEN